MNFHISLQNPGSNSKILGALQNPGSNSKTHKVAIPLSAISQKKKPVDLAPDSWQARKFQTVRDDAVLELVLEILQTLFFFR